MCSISPSARTAFEEIETRLVFPRNLYTNKKLSELGIPYQNTYPNDNRLKMQLIHLTATKTSTR